jgi:Sel1 repeat
MSVWEQNTTTIKKTLGILLLAAGGLAGAARADTLEEGFDTVWESLWAQTGMPTVVIRWADEIRVRFTGSKTAGSRDYAWAALRDVTQASGIALRDVSAAEDAAEIANLEFQLLADDELSADMPCRTRLQRWREFLLQKVTIQARATRIAFCAHHEAMHAMGIRGHPSGRTVLRYFAGARGVPYDALLPMDVLMLKTWYSPRMKPGATPFEALLVLTDAVVETTIEEPNRDAARDAQAAFLRKTLQDMERFARGEGEVPAIVLRSGWANAKAMGAGQTPMAYFVGLAHFHGIGTKVDQAQAKAWFERAAEKGSIPAKIMLMQPVITPAP